MNKYRAKHVYWDKTKRCVIDERIADNLRSPKQKRLPGNIQRFDSQHEFRVYLELVRMYGTSRINTQVPIAILPPGNCFPNGKKWKVDFTVQHKHKREKTLFLVEAKGVFTREFAYTLGCLEAYAPSLFKDLKLIFPRLIPRKNKVVRNLYDSDWTDNLMTVKQLKQTKSFL